VIERMKKVYFFLFYRDKKKRLGSLQALGLVHLETTDRLAGKKHEKLKKLKERYQSIVRHMRRVPQPDSGETFDYGFPRHLKALRARLQYLEDRLQLKERFENALIELERDRKALLPWGSFSLSRIDRLRSRGLHLRFMIGSPRIFDEFDFGGLPVEVIRREGDRVYFLVLEYRPEQPAVLPFEEVSLPRRELGEIEQDIAITRGNLEVDKLQLYEMSAGIPALEREIRVLESAIQFEEAKTSLGVHAQTQDSIFTIQGWFPVRREAELRAYLDRHGVSYCIDEPDAGEHVPVLLKNRRPGRLFEPVTRIFSLPDYFELDPTPFFAPFFALFFGLCLGDLGYGAILSLIAGVFAWRASAASGTAGGALRPLAYLGLILGVSTMINGVLLNTVFGQPLFDLPGANGFLSRGGELALFASHTIRGETVFPAMTLALLLGYVQILLGGVLRGVNAWRQDGWMYAMQPAATLFMLLGGTVIAVHRDFLDLGFNADFAIGVLPVGAAVARVSQAAGWALVTAGLLVFFLFNNPGLKIFLRPLVGLWEFYQFLTGLLGDFLSYIRLFALGLASGLLGGAFNQIAFMILPRGPDGDPIYATPLILLTAVILVLGHSLNLALSALGAFVHPLRLTFVEFYKNLYFRGGGKLFRPFAIQR
jgi:V/A-type H+-transporting ATPase subunit I